MESTSNLSLGQILNNNLPLYQFIIVGICSGIICLIGLIGNFLTGIVLFVNRKKSSLYILLLFLTIWDIIFLITTFEVFSIEKCLKYLGTGKYYLEFIHSRAWPWIYSIRSLAQVTSCYFTVGISLERFIAVTFPLKAHFICSKAHSFYGSIILIILSILYNFPRWFDYESIPIYENDAENNGTEILVRYKSHRTEFSKNPTYKQYYLRWGFFASTCLIPFVLLSIFNFMIYRKVREMHKIRKAMTDRESNERNLTRMICTLVLISLIVTLSCLLLTVVDTFIIGPPLSLTYELSNYGWANQKLIVVLNSSINPFLYCWFGKQFRNEIMGFYLRRKRISRNLTTTTSSTCGGSSSASRTTKRYSR